MIDAALDGGRAWLRLPQALEHEYEKQSARMRNRGLSAWLLIFGFLNIFYLFLNLFYGFFEPFSGAALMRVGMIASLVFAPLLLRPNVPMWLQSAAVVVPHFGNVLGAVVTAVHAPMPFQDRIITWGGVFVFLTNVISPMRLRDAVVFAVSASVGYGALLLGSSESLVFPQEDNVLHTAVLALISVALVYRQEKARRYAFLLAARDRLNTANLFRLSRIDPLTGLFNRRVFDSALDSAWAAARLSDDCIGLIMMDLDHFKSLNDASGHEAGDRTLCAVAEKLRTGLRPDVDTVARVGGEEFAIVLPGMDENQVVHVAECIRTVVEDLALPHPTNNRVTLSLGVAADRPAQTSVLPVKLLQAADLALYAAKSRGRNRVIAAGQLVQT